MSLRKNESVRTIPQAVLFAAGLVACSSGGDEQGAPLSSDASSRAASTPTEGGVVEDATTSNASASDSGVATDASSADSGATKKRVFVSSKTYTGDLKGAGAGVSGAEGADKLCNALATAAALGGTWKAWISVTGTKAASRLSEVGGWHLVGAGGAAGGVVFADLGATTLAAARAINRTESGGDVVGMVYPVWTGTLENGTVGETCADWTSAAAAKSGTRGASNGTIGWTEHAAPGSCDEKKAIYCFEQ